MKNGSLCVATGHLLVKICLILDPLLIDNLFPSYDKIIITGDFNLPNISWTGTTHTSTGLLGQNFCDILDDYFMTQLCITPTRESNILDLLIRNPPEQISSLDICDPTEIGMTTDHKVIRFTCCDH